MWLAWGVGLVGAAEPASELPFVQTTPTGIPADREVILFASAERVGPRVHDQPLRSDWSYVRCSVEDGRIYYTFRATPATWPTTWPERVTCTGDGVEVARALTPVVNYQRFEEGALAPGEEIALDVREDLEMARFYTLPPGPAYGATDGPARRGSGDAWRGVRCMLDRDQRLPARHLGETTRRRRRRLARSARGGRRPAADRRDPHAVSAPRERARACRTRG